jgi:hypothetical protein
MPSSTAAYNQDVDAHIAQLRVWTLIRSGHLRLLHNTNMPKQLSAISITTKTLEILVTHDKFPKNRLKIVRGDYSLKQRNLIPLYWTNIICPS